MTWTIPLRTIFAGSPPSIREPSNEIVDRKSTRLNSSHQIMSYAVFCLKKKTTTRAALKWPFTHFVIPDEIYHAWDARESGARAECEWRERFDAYRSKYFFFNDAATPEIYTLSLHDALPISDLRARTWPGGHRRVRSGRDRIGPRSDRKSTRLNSSHQIISYAVFCLKKQ